MKFVCLSIIKFILALGVLQKPELKINVIQHFTVPHFLVIFMLNATRKDTVNRVDRDQTPRKSDFDSGPSWSILTKCVCRTRNKHDGVYNWVNISADKSFFNRILIIALLN